MKKTLVAVVSAAVTAVLFQYVWFHNWGITLFIMISLILHELAHAAVLLIYGVKPVGMIFVPFLGAAVSINRRDMNRLNFKQKALMSIAGPLSNVFLTAVGGIIYLFLPGFRDYGIALAGVNATLAVINLLPFGGLDGGGVSQALFESLDEKDDRQVATLISIAAAIAGFAIILLGKSSFLYLLIWFGIRKKSREDNPNNVYSPEAMPRKFAIRLATFYGVVLIATMILEEILPDWLEIFHIWPAK